MRSSGGHLNMTLDRLTNLRRTKLELAQPIRWGSWSGREPAYSGQDVLILEKKN